MAGLSLDEVPDAVPTTGSGPMPKQPVNLSFDEE